MPKDNNKRSLIERMRMLRLARRYERLAQEVKEAEDEARQIEGATCGYCGSWRTWKELTDESTQTERRPTICSKCIRRRKIAHENGWHEWPNRL